MTRRRYSRQRTRKLFTTRAPRKGTLIVAFVFYLIGICGALEWYPIPDSFVVPALAIAGALLLLGALLRDL